MRWNAQSAWFFVLLISCGDTIFFGNDDQMFETFHGTLGTGGNFEKIFQPTNTDATGNCDDYLTPQDTNMSGLQGILDAVAEAAANNKRLRAYGSKFSYNNMPYNDEYVLETCRLNYAKIGLQVSQLDPAYTNVANQLAFIQAGVRIQEFHKQLFFDKGLNLKTMGNSDGQRVVGAISTGTHGSRTYFGSTQDFVKGIHLVIVGEHVFLQRDSDKVVNANFIANNINGARLIEDDDLFNAALVNLGSFGIIHAIVIEAEPAYRLRGHFKQFHYPDIKNQINTLDVAGLGFGIDVDRQPYHFEVLVDPYNVKSTFLIKGASVKIFEQETLSPEEIAEITSDNQRMAEFSVPAKYTEEYTMGRVYRHMDTGPLAYIMEIILWPFRTLLNKWKRTVYGPINQFVMLDNDISLVYDFPNQVFFGNDNIGEIIPFVPGINMEIAVSVENLSAAVDALSDVLKDNPLPTLFIIRYIKKSGATLAFEKFDTTAMIEIPGFYDGFLFRNTVNVYEKLNDRMVAENIPHAFHWGKYVYANKPEWVTRSYGDSLTEWKAQRTSLLGPTGSYIFSSDLTDTLGLTG